MYTISRRVFACVAILLLASCAGPGDVAAPRDDTVGIARLAATIQALGPEVDPAEAQRAARISYEYSQKLAIAYQIEDPPLVHNAKVNRGAKPRGLCWHWADDMELRLAQENFRTLDMHRAIANAFNLLIEHSTVIVSASGDTMQEGIVIDPWRYGGTLFWSPTLEDKRYNWIERLAVFQRRIDERVAKGELPPGSRAREPLPGERSGKRGQVAESDFVVTLSQ